MEDLKPRLLRISREDVFALIAVFVIYAVAAKLCLTLYYGFNTSPALIWAPVGIALAAVIFGGYKMWVPIFLAQFIVVYLQLPEYYVTAFVIAVAYALQAVIGLYALRRLRFKPDFGKLRNTLLIVGAAFFITMIEPFIATLFQWYGGTLTVSPLLNFGRAWGGGIFSVLVITPFIATWYNARRKDFSMARKEGLELIALFALLCGVNYFLFWTSYVQYVGIAVIFFLPAVLIWFGLRFHPRWLTLALVLTSFIGIAGSIIAHATPTPLNAQLLADEIYIGLVAAIFLVFVAVVEERRGAYRRLEQAYKLVAASDKAKNDFIAILAHELRNPLAPIVSSFELLKFEPQTPTSIEIIKSVEEHAQMMRRLLDDLLDTARLSQNKFKLQKELVNGREIIAQSVINIEPLLLEKEHTLNLSLPTEDMQLYVDPIRLKQILINLLANACKYTQAGGHIELTCKKHDSLLTIRVQDNGMGIENEKISHIFEPFMQVVTSTHSGGGLGLGLFLTKNLIEMHGGTISVWSAGIDKGTVFTVELPTGLQSLEEQTMLENNTRRESATRSVNRQSAGGLANAS